MGPRCTHIALHVRELEPCVEFYRDFCGLRLIRERGGPAFAARADASTLRSFATAEDGSAERAGTTRVVWLAEPGRESEFIFVLISGGPGRAQADNDFSHLGFALESKAAVDAVAARGRAAGCLAWAPRQEPYPVGYYCGLRDPDGGFVEFSFGQPLGPGSDPSSTVAKLRRVDAADSKG